jgi:hypothetical protein
MIDMLPDTVVFEMIRQYEEAVAKPADDEKKA